jgi:hypothetical protein
MHLHSNSNFHLHFFSKQQWIWLVLEINSSCVFTQNDHFFLLVNRMQTNSTSAIVNHRLVCFDVIPRSTL